MRRLTSLVTTVLIIVASIVPIKAQPTQTATVPGETLLDDTNTPEPATRLLTHEERVELHDRVYEQYMLLQESKAEVSEDVEDVPLVDVQFEALVRATWRLETGNGTSPMWLNNNNPGGIKLNGVYHTFSSKEEGYQYMRDLLQYNYVDVYGYDIKAIRDVYCQCGPDDYPKFMQIYEEELNK